MSTRRRSSSPRLDSLIAGSVRVTRREYRLLLADVLDGVGAQSAHRTPMERALARVMILAELIGQSRAWRDARRAGVPPEAPGPPVEPQQFAAPSDAVTVLASIDEGLIVGPFLEAVQAFDGRVPTLASTVRRIAARARLRAGTIIAGEVASGAQTIAGSFAESVRGRFWVSGLGIQQQAELKSLLAQQLRGAAVSMPEFIESGSKATMLTDRRLELIYRNNVNTAAADGQAEILNRPAVQRAIPLVMIDEINDFRTRGRPDGLYPEPHRHWQMDGYVNTMAEIDRQGLRPPNGHQCRAGLRPVSIVEAMRLGLLDERGRPDPDKIAAYNGERQHIIDRGEYPDRGFKAAA